MFSKIKEFLANYLSNFGSIITMDDFTTYGDKKVEIVLSTAEHMASISILTDFTYDFLAVTIEDEHLAINKTINCKDIDDLYNELKSDITCFANLSKK